MADFIFLLLIISKTINFIHNREETKNAFLNDKRKLSKFSRHLKKIELLITKKT